METIFNISRRNFIIRSSLATGFSLTFPYKAFSFDGSGEGSARILEPDKLVAGKTTRVIFEVTIGMGGIPVGGGIWLGVHHAAIWNSDYGVWSTFQADNPGSENFIGICAEQADNFESVWYGWAPQKSMNRPPRGQHASDWSGSTPLIYHQCLQAKVKNKPLHSGDKVVLVIGNEEFGARAPIVTGKAHEFFIAVDSDASGVFKGIGEYPKLEVFAADAAYLKASGHMIQKTKKTFEILIRAEDQFCNTDKSFIGKVNIRSEEGHILAKNIKLKAGIGSTKIRINHPGPQRLYLESKEIKGRSEPFMIFDALPEYKLFFGDIHGHSRVSDGCSEPDEFYSYAREESNLDVCALTDHRHNDWELMKRMVKKYYEPGKFVTLLAEEGGTGSDHFNIYHRSDDKPHVSRTPKSYEEHYNILEEDYLLKGFQVLGGPHHFAFNRGEKCYPFEKWDSRFARFIEVYSNHGTSEFYGNPRPLNTTDPEKTMQAGLKQGLRFGVIASSDTHVPHPGRSNWLNYPGALAAFLAPKLDREAIWDAMWNRRVYGMSFDRIYIDFKINDQIMGSEISAIGTCQIFFEVVGRDEPIEVVLVRNNEDYKRLNSPNGIVRIDFMELMPKGDNFYYLRVTQQNQERAWSTPIWVQHS